MPKWRTRICSCGKEEYTASKSPICASCYTSVKKENYILLEKEQLKKMGYLLIGDHSIGDFGKRVYTLQNQSCNHTFSARYDNLISVYKRTSKLSCGICGNKENMKNRLSRYIAKYGRDNDITKFEEYKKEVRALTEVNYKINKDILNNENNLSGHNHHHLDHKVPIAMCFRSGISPEKAASIENLQVLPYSDNLSKSWYAYDPELLEELGGIIKDEVISKISYIALEIKNLGYKVLLRGHKLIINDSMTISFISDDVDDIKPFSSDFLNIREFELISKTDVVLNRILHKCNITKNRVKIFARKCIIKEVSTAMARIFCERNHLQNYTGASCILGLFFGDHLVSIMTFGKPRFTKEAEWELIRFCVDSGYYITGAASKLLKEFKRLKMPNSIISYADARWSNGNLYKKIDFEFIKISPSFFYISKEKKVLSRYKCQKHKLMALLEDYDENLTANENMKNNGYKYIKDPGQLVFIWHKEQIIL